MITKWEKSRKEYEEVLELDEENTLKIHTAPHDPHAPHLLCVLQRENSNIWSTFCLSDFIRSR